MAEEEEKTTEAPEAENETIKKNKMETNKWKKKN